MIRPNKKQLLAEGMRDWKKGKLLYRTTFLFSHAFRQNTISETTLFSLTGFVPSLFYSQTLSRSVILLRFKN